jgi:hypothetical protein
VFFVVGGKLVEDGETKKSYGYSEHPKGSLLCSSPYIALLADDVTDI